MTGGKRKYGKKAGEGFWKDLKRVEKSTGKRCQVGLVVWGERWMREMPSREKSNDGV
jgi:hypothetical protein